MSKVLNNDSIQAFLLAVERKSVTESARRLGLSKSVVSKRISDLERTLGVQLMLRSTHGIMPTDAGLAFYEAAAASVRLLAEAAEEIAERSQGLCGTLRITAPVSLTRHWLAPAIARFAARYPRLWVTMETEDRIVNIEAERYDLAIRSGRMTDSALIAQRIATCERIIVCSPDYRVTHGEPASLEQLLEHRCLNYGGVPASTTWTFDVPGQPGKSRTLSPEGTFVANNGDTLCEAAVQGLGIAILPAYIVARGLREGRLVRILSHETPQAEIIYAVHPRNHFANAKLKAFIDHIRAALIERPWYGLAPSADSDPADAAGDTECMRDSGN